MLSAIVPSISPSCSALLGLCRGWASSGSWNREPGGAGVRSQLTKVRLKRVLGASEFRKGRPSVVEAGTGEAAPLLLWMGRQGGERGSPYAAVDEL